MNSHLQQSCLPIIIGKNSRPFSGDCPVVLLAGFATILMMNDRSFNRLQATNISQAKDTKRSWLAAIPVGHFPSARRIFPTTNPT
jgi:hypothetical protein